MAKVSSRCASYVGGSAGTTKMSSPPERGLSWAAAGRAPAARRRIARTARVALDVNDDLERIADPVHVGVERLGDLIQREVVADDRVGDEVARAHERQRPPAVHAALAARGIDADIAPHGEVH